MRTVDQYLQYERDCRRLAGELTQPGQKQALEAMAAAWAKLAADAKAQRMKENRARRPNSRHALIGST